MLNSDDYSAVMVKWLANKHLRANDYSAVMVNHRLDKDLWKIDSFLARGGCVRAMSAAFGCAPSRRETGTIPMGSGANQGGIVASAEAPRQALGACRQRSWIRSGK
jgi:hypothetical protein